jgi:hypothetical protein
LDAKTVREALDSTEADSKFEATVLEGNVWKKDTLPTRQLQNILVDGVLPAERLATGTRFVLKEWLKTIKT